MLLPAAATDEGCCVLGACPARCTAVTAVVVGERLLVANVGDSRAVLSRGGKGVYGTVVLQLAGSTELQL